jgi:hypothetical protein
MAKYVLVAFDDDSEADTFTKMLIEGAMPDATMRVEAVFKKPTKFCECETPSEKSSRGQKWGWWLCRNPGCGKPKRDNFQQPRNLLEPEGLGVEKKRIFINLKEPLHE